MRKHPLGKALLLLLMACLCALALCSCSMLDMLFGKDDPDDTTTTPDHTHSYTVSVVEPTCTEEGYTLHTCACGDTFRDNITQAGHTLSYVGAQASACSEAGHVEHWHCDRCGKNFSDENGTAEMADVTLPPAAHTFGAWVTVKEADCMTEGSEQRTCSVCRTAEVRPIAPISHALSHVQAQASTCSAAGHTEHWHCDRCGKNFSDENGTAEMASVTLPLSAHTFGAWVTVKEADCTAEGSEKRTCSVCQATETRTIDATGHTYASGWSYNKTEHWHAATCGHTDQTKDKTAHTFNSSNHCTVCGYEKVEATPNEFFSFTLLNDDTYEIIKTRTVVFDPPTEIILPDTYNGKPVTSIGKEAFAGYAILKSIIIPDSVTTIGEEAFEKCTSLESVVISENVTSIGVGAFAGCSSLESIVIPDNVTSIGEEAFAGCSSLASVIIPDNVTSIGAYAFWSCSSLPTLAIPDSVTTLGEGAFLRCYSLTDITIPDSVTTIGDGAFYYCTSLTNITISNSVTSIGEEAFNGTAYYNDDNNWKNGVLYIGNHLIKADPDLSGAYKIKNGTLTIAGGAFYECSALTSVTIPDGIISVGGYAFYSCFSLTNITIPDGVTSIGDYAFYSCSSLTNITIPDGVTSIGGCAFENCTLLTNITIPDSVITLGDGVFRGCSSLTSVTIGNSVTTIGDYAFCDCVALKSVSIGNSVTTLGDGAFANCSPLKSITIPNSVTSIGDGAFAWCSSLATITISNSVRSIGYKVFEETAYYNNEEHWENGVLYIGNHLIKAKTTFSGSYGSYNIKNGTLTIAGGTFEGCSSLTSVTIPSGVRSIGDRAFYGCKSLTGIAIPDSVTTIGSSAFYGCTSVTFIIIGNNVTTIGNSAFYGCNSFMGITIPDSVTTIGEYAFSNCSALNSVVIGNGVTSIGISAFYGCPLNSVTFKNTNGWQVSTSSDMSNRKTVEVSAPVTAALYLKSIYYDYYWQRN